MVVYGVCRSRRLDIDCSTGRRTMEWADEPPSSNLLYQAGLGGWGIKCGTTQEWAGGEKEKMARGEGMCVN